MEWLTEARARSWSRPALSGQIELIWEKEDIARGLELYPLASRGEHELYHVCPWFIERHVDVSTPPETEPQLANETLFLTQSLDPCHGHGEAAAALGSALQFNEACNLH